MFLQVNADELKKRRLRAGLSQYALAKKANLPGNAAARLEKGKSLRTNHLRAKEIAAVLGCKVEDIFTSTNKGV